MNTEEAEEADAEGELAEETIEVTEVSSTAVSPEPIPVQVERPVRGRQMAIRGRGTKYHPYMIGFHDSWTRRVPQGSSPKPVN